MNPLRKLVLDTRQYLFLLNKTGKYSLMSLVLVVDYWIVVFYRLQEFVVGLPCIFRQIMQGLLWCIKPFAEGMSGARIRVGASIGPGFVVYNSFGVVISSNVEIGENCTIYSGVLIAHNANDKGFGVPRIGNGVVLMSGSKVLGDVTVGDGAIVGANSVVIRDVPKETIVIGVPAI